MYAGYMRTKRVDHYEVLGVAKDASLKDINTAYKKLALKYHPDKTGDEENYANKFREVCTYIRTTT